MFDELSYKRASQLTSGTSPKLEETVSFFTSRVNNNGTLNHTITSLLF